MAKEAVSRAMYREAGASYPTLQTGHQTHEILAGCAAPSRRGAKLSCSQVSGSVASPQSGQTHSGAGGTCAHPVSFRDAIR